MVKIFLLSGRNNIVKRDRFWRLGRYGCCCSIMVITSDCGSENLGSIPSSGTFYQFNLHLAAVNVGIKQSLGQNSVW